MATEKDSILGERIQKPSAPRAEPGAANTIIPRRDLLTGAALVLMGSAAGCGNAKPPLRTPFMAAFTLAFIGDPTLIKPPGQTDRWPDPGRKWPVSGQKKVDIVTDYETFANVLMTMGYVMGPPPAVAPGSLGEKIVQFIQAQNWPTTTTVPPDYQTESLPTVHLIEISVILDRLMQAMNSFGEGGGGGGSDWPPH